jgi:hypothetical protein
LRAGPEPDDAVAGNTFGFCHFNSACCIHT